MNAKEYRKYLLHDRKVWSSTHRLCAYTEGHDKTNGIDAQAHTIYYIYTYPQYKTLCVEYTTEKKSYKENTTNPNNEYTNSPAIRNTNNMNNDCDGKTKKEKYAKQN